MIRFIDLRGQVFLDSPMPHFAYFDTVTDTFCQIGPRQEWSSLEDLKRDMDLEESPEGKALNKELERIWAETGPQPPDPPHDWRARYFNLIPDGYFDQ